MNGRPLPRRLCLAASAAILCAPALAATPEPGKIPDALNGMILGGSKRAVGRVEINGVPFDAVRVFSDAPYLLWPAEEGPLGADDPQLFAPWLARASGVLGFEGFEPRYVETCQWHSNEVWAYELVRDGAVLHDARLMVHRNGGRVVGIVNHISGRIGAIDAPDGLAAGEWVYYAVPAGDGAYRALAAVAERTRLADRDVLRIISREGDVLEVEHSPDPGFGGREVVEFTEYVVPEGSFPDQISVDPDGVVWFSDPWRDRLYSFEPVGETFGYFPTTGASGPDGMIVGTAERVWTGMYFSGGLGVLDKTSGDFAEFDPPYGGAAMAIPVETSDGRVWVTDHQSNRISEFDPATGAWVKSIVMPTPNCWVVQGYEDRDRGQVYFTEYNANKLGRVNLGGNTVTDLLTPGGGPAFCVYSDGKVYYSRWNENGIGVYDVVSGQFTEYNFPVANENGGPLWLRPNGNIVCGTLNRGYIMVFDVPTQTFTALQVPTAFPGLKDGMTVAANDVIWFTETGVNKLGKLVFCPDTCCLADFDGDGTVNTLDVLAFLNAWAAGDSAADINGDGVVNTLDVLEFLNLWNAGC